MELGQGRVSECTASHDGDVTEHVIREALDCHQLAVLAETRNGAIETPVVRLVVPSPVTPHFQKKFADDCDVIHYEHTAPLTVGFAAC